MELLCVVMPCYGDGAEQKPRSKTETRPAKQKRSHHRPARTVNVEADRLRLVPDVQGMLGKSRASCDDKGSAKTAAQPCLQITYCSANDASCQRISL